jgi:hypothetical protein
MLTSLPEQIASQAEFIVNNHQETHYTHKLQIDVDSGVYDCDCSEFVGFVVAAIAPKHFAMIAAAAAPSRPLAGDYYAFFASPNLPSMGGWSQVQALSAARRGAIIAWLLPIDTGNTGHVFTVADTPVLIESGNFAVRVYDSAQVPHYDDTRGDGENGVGTGFINFQVDGAGSPTEFQFGPSEPKWVSVPIVIGRAEPLDR